MSKNDTITDLLVSIDQTLKLILDVVTSTNMDNISPCSRVTPVRGKELPYSNGNAINTPDETLIPECRTANRGEPTLRDEPTESSVPKEQLTLSAPNESTLRVVTPGSRVWNMYCSAYRDRYGVKPIRNAKTNSLCNQLAKRLGNDAPLVAAWYVNHRNQYYISKGHSLTCLVADAEKIWAEWRTDRQITQTEAREQDRLQDQGSRWMKLAQEYERNEK